MGKTTIGWTHHTFNPVRGCDAISEGCDNCYAHAMARRFPEHLGTWGNKSVGVRVVAPESQWQDLGNLNARARRSGRPLRVFVASAADVFEEWTGPLHAAVRRPGGAIDHVPALIRTLDGAWTLEPGPDTRPLTYNDVRGRLWHEVRRRSSLTFQILTKRTNRLDVRVPADPPPNAWLGTSVESQEWAERRLDDLLRTPVDVTFASVEPLLGPVDLTPWLTPKRRLSWVIVGGESGANARPCKADWIDDVIDQCRMHDVPVFVKQLGSKWAKSLGLDDDPKGEDWTRWPAKFRVRQFPDQAHQEQAA